MHVLQIKRHFQGEVLPLEVTSEKHGTMPFFARGVFSPWRSPLRNTKIFMCWQFCGVSPLRRTIGNSVVDVACDYIYV